jgi:pilus assembly protein CpaF
MADLVERGTLSPAVSAELSALVQRRMSLLISGATGTGKTTLLNALLGCIREDERVVTIEETAELQPSCPHWVPLVTREANVEGRGAVDQSTLVRAALRLRPDRLVVGEVRGPEALAALAALATGHEGSMLTVHARSGQDALHRMVSLALGGRSGASEDALTEQVQRAFGAVVHLERDGEGRRRVAAISYLS